MYSYFSHPNSVCMSYLQHAQFSSSIGVSLLIGSFQAFVHAILPSMYLTSSSDLSRNLHLKLSNAGCKK